MTRTDVAGAGTTGVRTATGAGGRDAAPVLEVDGLSVDIATPGGLLHAVRDVSFGVRRGETLFAIETDGEALPFPSPVAGKVVQVNHDLDYQLDLMRLRPYDQGWICTIDPEHLSSDLERLVIGADAVDRYQADVRRYDLRLAEELAATPLPGKKEAHAGEAERRAACRAFSRCFLPPGTASRREAAVTTGV